MSPRRILLATALLVLQASAILAQRTLEPPHFRPNRLVPGSDNWFAAVFRLTSPLEGGALHFWNHHLTFSLSAVSFNIPVRAAFIGFSRADSAGFSRLGGGQWVSHVPLGFNELGWPGGAGWDAATNLPGGVILTRAGYLLTLMGRTQPRGPRRAP